MRMRMIMGTIHKGLPIIHKSKLCKSNKMSCQNDILSSRGEKWWGVHLCMFIIYTTVFILLHLASSHSLLLLYQILEFSPKKNETKYGTYSTNAFRGRRTSNVSSGHV